MLMIPPALRPPLRSPLPMQTLDVDRSELKGGGYLATPDGSGPHPGVVVIHEAYGLNANIKDITHRFAETGYVALAVDLFTDRNRAVCMARYMTGMLLGSVNRYGVNDLKTALTYLANNRAVDPARMGAVGFCLGGGFAIAWASTDERLKAIAPFYGANPRPLEAVARLCPVVGSYPDNDFTTPQGQKLDVALDGYNIPHDIKIYPGTKHSFFNDQEKNYDVNAAQDSWQRVLTFFKEHIGQ